MGGTQRDETRRSVALDNYEDNSEMRMQYPHFWRKSMIKYLRNGPATKQQKK